MDELTKFFEAHEVRVYAEDNEIQFSDGLGVCSIDSENLRVLELTKEFIQQTARTPFEQKFYNFFIRNGLIIRGVGEFGNTSQSYRFWSQLLNFGIIFQGEIFVEI